MLNVITISSCCLLLSKNEYSTIHFKSGAVYSLKKYEKEIQCMIEDIDNSLEVIENILNIVDLGIVIIKIKNRLSIYNSFLSASLCWMDNDNTLILSDSDIELAKKYNLKLDTHQLTKYLVVGWPLYLIQSNSMWNKLNKLRTFEYLQLDLISNKVSRIPIHLSISNLERHYSPEILKQELIESIQKDTLNFDNISTDLSGGVDSASIAYILNKVCDSFQMYHAEASKDANNDTIWADSIAKNLGHSIRKLTSFEHKNNRFEIELPYVGDQVPSYPLLWADTEYYLQEIIEGCNKYNSYLHFIGIGGDELFSSVPATPWSVFRQERIKSIGYVIRYSLAMKKSTVQCLKDFISSHTIEEEFSDKIDQLLGSPSVNHYSYGFEWNESLKIPYFLKQERKQAILDLLKMNVESEVYTLNINRAKHQILSSLAFQKCVLSQVNEQLPRNISVSAPFLNFNVIKTVLGIPDRKNLESTLNKNILYDALKGIVPKEIFIRNTKGDYSDARYKSYRNVAKDSIDKLKYSKLVSMGIVDFEKLSTDLSMPTADSYKIDYFERFCMLERWLRQVEAYMQRGN